MSPFLTARWENLLLLNYNCPREILQPLVPKGVELDDWEGECVVSLVGFRFLDTKVKGLALPGHQNFEEVNLRFYVRRHTPEGLRRGVVFVKELVPKPLIAWVAKTIYGEPYEATQMGHTRSLAGDRGGEVSYDWRYQGARYEMSGSVAGPAVDLLVGSEAEFITEHYWGYTRRQNGDTWEYQVAHPRWKVWDCESSEVSGDLGRLYGETWSPILENPRSAFLAVGSEVSVFPGNKLTG